MKSAIKLMTIAVISVFLYSCQQEYEKPHNFSDVMYSTSYGTINFWLYNKINVKQGRYITFLDLSQGALSQQWSIIGQDGLKFLSSGFGSEVTDTLSRVSHIILDSVMNSETVNVYFEREGIFTVTWKDIFKDSTGYMNIPSVKDQMTQNWIFTKVFNIHVYGPLIPVINIMKNFTEPISNSIDTIRLLTGDKLTFSEASKGYPSAIIWNIEGGTPNIDVSPTFTTTFNEIGIFNSSDLVLIREVANNSSLTSYLETSLPVIKVQ